MDACWVPIAPPTFIKLSEEQLPAFRLLLQQLARLVCEAYVPLVLQQGCNDVASTGST